MTSMHVVGDLRPELIAELETVIAESSDLVVGRSAAPRSRRPVPQSLDLELALAPLLVDQHGFVRQWRIPHARSDLVYVLDFHRPADGVSIEVMGYRSDDEVYKDLLKFQIHAQTYVGVLWVPRWKWISGRRGPTNLRATLKAMEFAFPIANVSGLAAIAYDWTETEDGYRLSYTGEP